MFTVRDVMSPFAMNNGYPMPSLHEVFIEGTVVECNYIDCDYREELPSVDDAEVAKEVHERLD